MDNYNPRFSPDARFIAYASEESGRPEVLVAPLDAPGATHRVSREGGILPRWRKDGRELYFLSPDGMLFAVRMRADGSPEDAAPTALFRVGSFFEDFTFEVAPDGHHLFLSIENGDSDNAFMKVNPPLRHEQVRKELWKAWDRIDVIASDHAPHTKSEKQKDFSEAPSGIPGVETMLPLLMAEFHERRITLPSIIKKTSWTPADLLGIPRAGFRPGMRADFALYGGEPRPITAEYLHSRAGWTPYEGMPGLFPERFIRDGGVLYDGGEFFSRPPRWYAGRGLSCPGPDMILYR